MVLLETIFRLNPIQDGGPKMFLTNFSPVCNLYKRRNKPPKLSDFQFSATLV